MFRSLSKSLTSVISHSCESPNRESLLKVPWPGWWSAKGAAREAPVVAKASSHTACPVSWGRGPAYKLTKYTRNACTMGFNVGPNGPPIDYLIIIPFSDSRKMPSSCVTCLKQYCTLPTFTFQIRGADHQTKGVEYILEHLRPSGLTVI